MSDRTILDGLRHSARLLDPDSDGGLRFRTEADLRDVFAAMAEWRGLSVQTEVNVGLGGRADIVIEGNGYRYAVEVKVAVDTPRKMRLAAAQASSYGRALDCFAALVAPKVDWKLADEAERQYGVSVYGVSSYQGLLDCLVVPAEQTRRLGRVLLLAEKIAEQVGDAEMLRRFLAGADRQVSRRAREHVLRLAEADAATGREEVPS